MSQPGPFARPQFQPPSRRSDLDSPPVKERVTLHDGLRKPRPTPDPELVTCTRTFTYADSLGLHARPAAQLVQTVCRFQCAVTAQHDGHQVSVRSILGVLSLAAGPGSQITFTARGHDADAALAAVARLFENRFGAAYAPRPVTQPPSSAAPAG